MTQTKDIPAASEKKDVWGDMFKDDGKTGTESLRRLLTGVAQCILTTFEPSECNDLFPTQLAAFYREVGGDYDSVFYDTPDQIAFIYRSLGCLHSLQPSRVDGDGYSSPRIPALKIQGFITWQTIQLLLCPEDNVPCLQNAVAQLDVIDPQTQDPFPKDLPADAFPKHANPEMTEWFNQVSDTLRKSLEASTPVAEDRPPQASPGYYPHRRPEGHDSRSHTPRDSPRHDRHEYFTNPYPRDRDREVRPAIIRRFGRDPRTGGPRSPRDYLTDKVRHLWDPSRRPKPDRRPSLPDRYGDDTSVSSRSSSPGDEPRRHSHAIDQSPLYEYDRRDVEDDLTPTGQPTRYSESPFRSSKSHETPPPVQRSRSPSDSDSESSDTASPPPRPRHHGRYPPPRRDLKHRWSDEPPTSPRDFYHSSDKDSRRHPVDGRGHLFPAGESNRASAQGPGGGFGPSKDPIFAAQVANVHPSATTTNPQPRPAYAPPMTAYAGAPPQSSVMAPRLHRRDSSLAGPPSYVGQRAWSSTRDEPSRLMRSGSLNRDYRNSHQRRHRSDRAHSWERGGRGQDEEASIRGGSASGGGKARQGVRYVSSTPQGAGSPHGVGSGVGGISVPGMGPVGIGLGQAQPPFMGQPVPPGGRWRG